MRWWNSDPSETFWLESTDRQDVGFDLRAPLLDAAGKPNWRYTLFQEARPGDIVLHYWKPKGAIVGWSRIQSPYISAPIVWGARGTYARDKGVKPHERAGYRIPLSGLTPFPAPLTLAELQEHKKELKQLVQRLQDAHPAQTLYFPFELADRPIRPLQGYAFKVPRAFVAQFTQLAECLNTHSAAGWTEALPEEFSAEELETVPEGAKKTIQVNVYERDKAARERAIHHWGTVCQVCEFDFAKVYGDVGKGYIHVHHTKPLGEMGGQYQLDPVLDLRPVCPNCHAMLHRTKPALTVEELRLMLLSTAR